MKSLLLSTAIVSLWMSAIGQKHIEYNGIEAIKEIHDGWLIVRLPGFENKIATLDSLFEVAALPEKSRLNLQKEKLQTLAQRDFIHKWYPIVFDSAYTFSHIAFIYSEETAGFQSGKIPARSGSGEQLTSVYQQQYVFATLNGIESDPFRFTTKDHRLLASPFPNNIGMPGFPIPGMFSAPMPEWISRLGPDKNAVYRAYRHATRVNRKLSTFYIKRYENRGA